MTEKDRGKKEKLLLIGYRAYGDWIYFSPVLPYLFERYEVHADMNAKGIELFHDDPRFASIRYFELEKYPKTEVLAVAQKRWKELEEEIKPDRVINLWQSLEVSCIAERWMDAFSMPVEKRREIFGSKTFYEQQFAHCDVEMPKDVKLGGLYFTEEQMTWGMRWRQTHINDYVIIMPIAGSCTQKVYPDMPRLTQWILDTYPSAYIYLVGDESVRSAQWDHPRIKKLCGEVNFKQLIVMTKFADYVFGPETGTLVAAGMWGTPKTMLCTTSSVLQCVKYQENDHSLQSKNWCSPCHKAIYNTEDCDDMVHLEGDIVYPKCILSHDFEEIKRIIAQVYEERNIYNRQYFDRYVERGMSEIGHKIYESRWNLIEKYCHGSLKLLDYGCASGAFHKSSRNGFETFGFDVNPHCGYTKVPDRVNILTMWDVVEHLKDPKETIKSIDADFVFLSTPNLHDGVDFATWKHNRPNEHLHYFDYESLSRLLRESGYKVIEHNFEEGGIRDPEHPEDIITVAAVKA